MFMVGLGGLWCCGHLLTEYSFETRCGTVPIHLVDKERKERKHMEKSFQRKLVRSRI